MNKAINLGFLIIFVLVSVPVPVMAHPTNEKVLNISREVDELDPTAIPTNPIIPASPNKQKRTKKPKSGYPPWLDKLLGNGVDRENYLMETAHGQGHYLLEGLNCVHVRFSCPASELLSSWIKSATTETSKRLKSAGIRTVDKSGFPLLQIRAEPTQRESDYVIGLEFWKTKSERPSVFLYSAETPIGEIHQKTILLVDKFLDMRNRANRHVW